MIRLAEINKENIEDVLALRVAEGQRRFVVSTAESLARAYVYHSTAWPFAVYDGDTPVGFIMFGYYEVKRYYTLWEFMIDERYQGRGFGRAALSLGLKFARERLGVRELYTGCVPTNAGALGLYHSLGFRETGEAWDGMLELRLAFPGEDAGEKCAAAERMERVREMEGRLNRLLAWLRDGAGDVREDVRLLDAYYRGSLWRSDFEADEAGALPADLPRGVLSEDAVYNALMEYQERA